MPVHSMFKSETKSNKKGQRALFFLAFCEWNRIPAGIEMSKMKSWDELKKIREESKQFTEMRTIGDNPDRIIITVGMATCGIAAGARETMSALSEEIKKMGLENISIIATGCFGFCYLEPVVEVRTPDKPPIRYKHVDSSLAKEIINKHIIKGELVDNAII